jgi:hypothetical protein
LLVIRELDEWLGFGELIERHLTDGRGKNTKLPLTELVQQSVYGPPAGYEDVDDAKRLSQDPAFPDPPGGRPSYKPVVRYKSFLY